MTRNMPKPGSFYVFISNGLGNIMGLGAAYLATFSYLLLLCGSYIFLGVCANELYTSLTGMESPWWVWTALVWGIVTTFGFLHIEFSAKALSIAMVGEVLIIMIFNAAVLFKNGFSTMPIDPLMPQTLVAGNIPVAVLFVILVFIGFEATALYREEVKSPEKTIPRATYTSVLAIGLFYGFTCYMMIAAYGDSAVDIATKEPSIMFSNAIHAYLGQTFTQIKNCFVVFSLIAALISIHNVLTRYVLNMAVDGTLPKSLSKIHKQHRSPYRSSFAVSLVAAVFLIIAMVAPNVDPIVIYGLTGGLGAVGIIFLMALVSLAIVVWFLKLKRRRLENPWNKYIFPTLAATSFMLTAVYSIKNFEIVAGGEKGENMIWLGSLAGVFALGVMLAIYFRLAKPQIYKSIGRSETIFNE
ncbi:hypothetical protein PspTeo4_18600 [Pseudomonas sp. Teo4]|nr:hypothetical protein [Pseudomonas sp. Teo4]